MVKEKKLKLNVIYALVPFFSSHFNQDTRQQLESLLINTVLLHFKSN